MNKLADIVDAARKLTREERQRLVAELEAMECAEPSTGIQTPQRLSALRALSGAFHSDYADLLASRLSPPRGVGSVSLADIDNAIAEGPLDRGDF